MNDNGRHVRTWFLEGERIANISLPGSLSRVDIDRLKRYVAALEYEASIAWEDEPLADPVHQQVREESRRFRAQLPELIKKYAGRWVVFRDGAVQADFDDEETAYTSGVQEFGVRGGFVIARVVEEQPLRIPG